MTKSLIRYHVIFTSALIGLTVILGVINSFLDSGGLTGVSAVTPFLAATFAAHSFLNRERKIPNAAEKNKLILTQLFIFLALNALILALVFFSGVLGEILPDGTGGSTLLTIIGVVFAILALINYFLMRWAYGGLLRKRAEKLGISEDQTDVFK